MTAPSPYLVRIGTKQSARLEFYDLGHSSGELVEKHLDAACEGESVRVFPASLPSQVGERLNGEFQRIFGSKA